MSKLSSPAPGRTIIQSIKEWSKGLIYVRYKLIENARKMGIGKEIRMYYTTYFEPKSPIIEQKELNNDKIELAIDAILSVWLMAVSTGYLINKSKLYDSISWFINGKDTLNLKIINNWLSSVDISPIQNLRYDDRFLEIFPYLLEIFETNNEIFLRGDQRLKKRKHGIFYTPSDVAFYMVKSSAENIRNDYLSSRWIDPSCGTGVFLRTIMEYYLKQNIISCNISSLVSFFTQHIYGIDISKSAVQSSVFTILTFCLSESRDKIISPWNEWQKIRGNIVVYDSTKIKNNQSKSIDINFKKRRIDTKTKCNFDLNNENCIKEPMDSTSIMDIFPEIEDGFTHFVTNPPYSKKVAEISRIQKPLFNKQIKTNPSTYSSFLDFIRMMWLFCNSEKRSCSIVVPLSITYNSAKSFVDLRKQIDRTKGHLYFANFDRTPDSLFGDDVKTRNTIIFYYSNFLKDNCTNFYTTSLLRWNSRKRRYLFKNISFIKLKRGNISQLIPKIGSEVEAEVYKKLLRLRGKCKTNIAVDFLKKGEPYKYHIYKGKTSYNWLSVYLTNPYSELQEPSKHTTLDVMYFHKKEDALLIFGLLLSKISYWLWRVEGDGFHLTKNFIMKLPFLCNEFSPKEKDTIINNAIELWNKMREKPITTKNSDVVSVTYCPYNIGNNLDIIDKIILKHYGFRQEYHCYFKDFVNNTIIAGREDEIH